MRCRGPDHGRSAAAADPHASANADVTVPPGVHRRCCCGAVHPDANAQTVATADHPVANADTYTLANTNAETIASAGHAITNDACRASDCDTQLYRRRF